MVVLALHLHYDVIDFTLRATKHRCCQQHDWRRTHHFNNLAQTGLVVDFVAVVVGAEKYHNRIPTLALPRFQYPLTKIDEPTGLCLHCHLPAQLGERRAHLIAIATSRAGNDGVPDH